MTKTACVFLAPGAEEIECVVAVDVLRRAEVNVTLAGLTSSVPVKCSRLVTIVPDCSIFEAALKAPFDVLVLPGGLGGSQALAKSEEVGKLLKEQDSNGRLIAAICAAPTALKAHGIGFGKNVTSYPSVELQMTEGGNYVYKQEKVVVDGNLITSRGPGTAVDFALKIVELLSGKDKATEVAKGMLLTY